MTASASIAGTLRAIPNAASTPPPPSGVSTHANFRSVLEQYHSSRESASEAEANRTVPRKKQKDSDTTPSTLRANPADNPPVPQAVTPPAEPPRPLLPFTASMTLRQDTTASPGGAADLRSVFLGSDSQAISTSAATELKTRDKLKETAPSQDIAAATPADPSTLLLTVTNPIEPPPPLHLPTSAPAPRQTAASSQNNPAATQDSGDSATDSKTTLPPVIERAEDTAAAPSQGSLAFAARLTPADENPAPAPGANRAPDSQPRPQTMLQTPVTARQVISQADLQSDAHSGESGNASSDQEKMSERFAKLQTLVPQTHAAPADQSAAAPASHALSASSLTVAARMDQVLEAPPAPSSGNHDITIRIPDATADQGTAVRFVERAGEVHVSVRTSDTDLAQTLRGGLNDLVTRLEDGGIRTQVWQPGADASTSQNNSQHPFADADGSSGRQYSSGSNSEQEPQQHNHPRWVEELESSIGTQNSKETPQLWQA